MTWLTYSSRGQKVETSPSLAPQAKERRRTQRYSSCLHFPKFRSPRYSQQLFRVAGWMFSGLGTNRTQILRARMPRSFQYSTRFAIVKPVYHECKLSGNLCPPSCVACPPPPSWLDFCCLKSVFLELRLSRRRPALPQEASSLLDVDCKRTPRSQILSQGSQPAGPAKEANKNPSNL